jgi:gliding motility-associated-like protein
MKRSKLIILLIVLSCKLSVSLAQIDTAFWFAAPWVTPDHWWRDKIVMHFAGPAGTVVKLRQPSAIAPNKYDTVFTIPSSNTFDYEFWKDKIASATNFGYDSLETRPANTVVPYGIYISSSANITVVYDVTTRPPNFYNPETFSLKGQNGLGREFVCPFQTSWFNQTLGGDLNGDGIISQPKQQINIVASKPNTTVWITPKCNVVGHLANISYSIFLPSIGSAYTVENMVQNTNVPGNNLSGSIIVADKDIAVTVADDSDRTPGGGCYDLIGDQIVPVDIVGKDYIVNKGAMVPGSIEGIYVVATKNFTGINITDAATTLSVQLNKGDTYFYNITQPLTSVFATENVYLWQASGIGCEAGGAILPPLSCAGSSLVAFSRNTPQRFNLNIVCKTGVQTTFTLNGSTTIINPATFSFVPGTNSLYVGAQIALTSTTLLPLGSYTIGNTADVFALGVFDGDLSTGGLFHYMSSFLRRTTVKTETMTPICANTPTVAVTGTVSGAAVTGSWTTANGTGTFGAYSSNFNTVSTIYSLSPSDASLTNIKFYLTELGNCRNPAIKDSVTVTVNQLPTLTVTSTNSLQCKNNVQPFVLSGNVLNASAAQWTGGNGGSFSSGGVNVTYTPSPIDIANGFISFTLTSQGPLPGCTNISKVYTVSLVNPPSVSAGPDITICTNTNSFVLNGSVSGTTVTPSWNLSSIGNFNPGSAAPNATFFPSAIFLGQTSVTFSLTVPPDGFCNSVTDVFTVSIVPQPTVNAGSNATVCASNLFVPLSGTVSGNTSTGTWSTPNGTGVFTQFGLASANYTLSQNDTLNLPNITFVLSSSGGLCPAVTQSINVQLIKSPLVSVGTSTAACESSPIQLSGNVVGFSTSNLWSSSSGTGSFVPNNTALNALYYPSAGDLANGFVTFTLTATSAACPPVSKAYIANFVKAPNASFQLAASACINSPLLFNNTTQNNGTSGLTYNWNFGNTITSTVKDPTHTYTATGSYVVTMTVTGTNTLNITCSDTVSKTIFVNPLPFANFTFTNACQALPIQFNDSSYATPGFITGYSWFFGPGTPTTSIKNPVFTFTTAGTFGVDLTVTSNFGCKRKVTKNVTVRNKPIADFGMTNNPTVAQEPVYFSDFSSPVGLIQQWIWNFGDETYANVQSPSHVYNNSGGYNITLTIFDDQGCRDTITKRIEVSLLPQVPTAFTPNGDGSNDLLFVKGGPFQKIKFKVYNNWGELIFETDDQTKGWDGKKNGEDQPVGVYVWTLEVDMYNNRVVKKNGDITIMR